MGDGVHLQANSGEQWMQLHQFSIVKQQASGDLTFGITVKEGAVPPPGRRLPFYAEADKAVNQKAASRVPAFDFFGPGGLRAADPAVSIRGRGTCSVVIPPP